MSLSTWYGARVRRDFFFSSLGPVTSSFYVFDLSSGSFYFLSSWTVFQNSSAQNLNRISFSYDFTLVHQHSQFVRDLESTGKPQAVFLTSFYLFTCLFPAIGRWNANDNGRDDAFFFLLFLSDQFFFFLVYLFARPVRFFFLTAVRESLNKFPTFGGRWLGRKKGDWHVYRIQIEERAICYRS